jgi:hypothetical protein
MNIRNFLTAILFFTSSFVFGQSNKIEILVNGKIVSTTAASIRISKPKDIIEVRILFNNTTNAEALVDSMTTQGCGILVNNILVAPDPNQQVQKAQTTANNDKFLVTRSKKAKKTPGMLVFSFSVDEITACPGKTFSMFLKYKRNSPIAGFAGFKTEYKFYYVL